MRAIKLSSPVLDPIDDALIVYRPVIPSSLLGDGFTEEDLIVSYATGFN